MQFIYYLLNNSYINVVFKDLGFCAWPFTCTFVNTDRFFYNNSNFKLVSYIRYIYKTLRLGKENKLPLQEAKWQFYKLR